GSAAVDDLLRDLAEPTRATVLVVGAGEVGKLAVRALRRRVGRILVVSLSGGSAERAAADAGGEAVALADVGQAIDAADAVISAADTRGTVLTADLLTARVAARPLVVVDIAMPRSVAADARLLHEPTAALRTKPSRAGAACDLFGIEP